MEEIPLHYIYHRLEDQLIFPKPLYLDKKLPKLPKEDDRGNREYKFKLNYNPLDQTERRDQRELKKKEKIASQLLYRLLEGNGNAIFVIGVKDNGDNIGISLSEIYESIHFLRDSCKIIQANMKSIKIYHGEIGYICTIRIHMYVNLNYNITLF